METDVLSSITEQKNTFSITFTLQKNITLYYSLKQIVTRIIEIFVKDNNINFKSYQFVK